MASTKGVHVSIFISLALLLVVFPLAVATNTTNEKKVSSPFEFVRHLYRAHKGDKVKDLHKLKLYLEKFGYLSYNSNNQTSHADNDYFDEALESSIKTYQLNFNLKVTGSLNLKTISKMIQPRCAVADIINGTTAMRSDKKGQFHAGGSKSKFFHSVSHFSFFPNNPRWPASKSHLTYAFLPGTRLDAIDPVARAFQTWAANTHFSFSETDDSANADIKISFESLDHGDNDAFDGPNGILAHAFAPTDGRFHFDADESWSISPTPGTFDVETVALHEIGHLLGLHHSSVEGAIMYPTIPIGESKGLHADDIQGIQALYI